MSDQLNSALTDLMSLTVHLFLFLFAGSEQYWFFNFDVLQDLGSEVVFWFVAQVHDHSALPIASRVPMCRVATLVSTETAANQKL